jgi:arylsulfatase A-like enzyme
VIARLLRIPPWIVAVFCTLASLRAVEPGRSQTSLPAGADGSILPFPPTPSASVAGPTLQESSMKWRKEPERLKPGAPNVLVVLIDDVGFGVPDTFGGEVHTPALTRLRDLGICFNAFHTTSICSPTRAALLTGRNHHRVGSGTIAERASDFDGYTGIIPKTSATIAETLHHYGYRSAAFGKWHNTPANQTTAMGPFDLVDGLEQLGVRDNTIILYIWGDNGSSAEGQKGSVSELLAQNNIANTIEQQIEAMNRIGGLPVLGGPKVDNRYHAGWAWAGSTPFRSTKRVAAHFGGTRNPMVVSWPKGINPDKTPRSQFHHVNDIVPTLYEVIGIKHPEEVNGFKQDPIDGVSMAYTFTDADAPTRQKTQYFENNASRGIYHDGWFACTFGPFVPWDTPSTAARLKGWNANNDVWELYDLSNDFSQADDLAATEPERLAKMKELFLAEAKANKALPIGGGLWTRFHPEDVITSPYRSWRFDATTTRMPEFTAPSLGKRSNHVTIDVEVSQDASGVLYALGGASGGVTLYVDQGQLVYEYNMLIIERTTAKSETKLTPGKHKIEVDETIAKPGAPADVIIKVDGQEVARAKVKRTVPGAFTASETFDVGVDLGSPVSLDYFDRAPFKFDGKIVNLKVELK